eukprot:scaffold53089_cov54-Phaeocystis_antarctica.AAC.2
MAWSRARTAPLDWARRTPGGLSGVPFRTFAVEARSRAAGGTCGGAAGDGVYFEVEDDGKRGGGWHSLRFEDYRRPPIITIICRGACTAPLS